MKRLVMCTSTGCLEYAPERYRNLGIDIIRIHLFFKGREYLEGYNLDPVDLYAQMEEIKEVKDALPRTAMPTYEEVSGHFQKAIDDGYGEVIVIAISSGLGGTYNFISLVAKDFADKLKIHVFDSRITCFCEGYMAVKAKELVDKGVPTPTIMKELEWIRKHQQFIGLDEKLDYLILNGRLKGAKAYMGKALRIVPVLHFGEDGNLSPLFNAMGVKGAIVKTINLLKEDIIRGRDEKDYILSHVFTGPSTLAKMKKIEETLGMKTNHEDVIMSPVSGIHNGPWLAGYCYTPIRRDDEPLE